MQFENLLYPMRADFFLSYIEMLPLKSIYQTSRYGLEDVSHWAVCKQPLSKMDWIQPPRALDGADIPRSCVGKAGPYAVLMQRYHSYPEMSPTLDLADHVHLPPLLLRRSAVAQHRAAAPPPSLFVSKAFPFLMTGKVQPLSFTSSEDSRDCKEYDGVKWYSQGPNIAF